MRTLLLCVVAAWASGCAGSPLAPSSTEQSRLNDAVALIHATPTRLPIADQPLGAWFDARVAGVYINERHPEYEAYRERETGRVFVRGDLTTQAIPRIAAALLHEARHADTPHTCGTHDRSLDEWGAWAVHAWFLEQHGLADAAASIRHQKICPH